MPMSSHKFFRWGGTLAALCLLLLVDKTLAAAIPTSPGDRVAVVSDAPQDHSDIYEALDFPHNIDCSLCTRVLSNLDHIATKGKTLEVVSWLAEMFCEHVMPPKMPDGCDKHKHGACKELCHGMVKEFGDDIVDLLQKLLLDPREVCSRINLCPHDQAPGNSTLPPYYPKHQLADSGERDQDGFGSFFHITDLHYDPDYTEGMDTDCGRPLCCRREDGPGQTDRTSAGRWGAFTCDVNDLLLDSLNTRLNQFSPKPEFVLWTGDGPNHDIWNQTKESNLGIIGELTMRLKVAMPEVRVFPCIGNHAYAPVNEFRGPLLDSWLYDPIADMWAPWLKDDYAVQTLRYGGYYTVLAEPGLRVVALNTNFYLGQNFFTLLNATDMGGQFAWLEDVLAQAEALNEQVYVIGHAPPQEGWEHHYADRFHEIISRYPQIVRNQFYGHTHHDSMAVFRDFETDEKPFSMAYVAPSVTPFDHAVNPSFRLFNYTRAASKTVLEYEQYRADLDDANIFDRADWKLAYKATEEYGLASLAPEEWQDLGERARYDWLIAEKFWGNLHGGVPIEDAEDDRVSCLILSGTSSQLKRCLSDKGLKHNPHDHC